LFGDSISVGANSDFPVRTGDGRTNWGYPSIYLEQILEDSRRPSVVINWGQGGSPSGPSFTANVGVGNGVERINGDLASTKQSYPGAISYRVLILYGTNDFGYGISPSDTGFYIRQLIQRARSQGFTPVVATLLARSDRSVVETNAQISAAASAESAALVDMYTHFNNAGGLGLLELDDGVRLHPTTPGYYEVASIWFNVYLKNVIGQSNSNAVITPILELLLRD
jgi:hypothetical protein